MAESWKSSIQNIPQTGRKQIYLQHILYFSVPQTFLLTFGGLTLDFSNAPSWQYQNQSGNTKEKQHFSILLLLGGFAHFCHVVCLK